MEHIPVLLNEVIKMVGMDSKDKQWMLDGTFGRGGHSQKMLETFKSLKILGLDRDHEAIEFGEKNFSNFIEEKRLYLLRGNYVDLIKIKDQIDMITQGQLFDVILLDLGVSSPQLDQGERGFSFYHDGPLDMRMDQRETLTAADIINEWDEQELSDLFYHLGEIKFPNKVVRAIIQLRKEKKITTTGALSELIQGVCGWSKKGQHPATKYFLALRIQVNKELEQIKEAIPGLIKSLNVGGRLLIITFHSSEDRIVKLAFKEHTHLGKIITKKVVQAQWPEKKKNPRARSAKLRVFERGVGDE